MKLTDNITFLKEFLWKPRSVGAIAPSSSSLACKMCERIDWASANGVIEYGAGTGAFTRAIHAHLKPDARFFAVEVNPNLAKVLRESLPGVRIREDSVRYVRRLCDEEGMDQADAVLCGLPWAAFSRQDQTDYLDAMMTVLRPGGQFATFAYLQGLLLPAAQRFRSLLGRYFSLIERSNIAWRNLPPAFVYRCTR